MENNNNFNLQDQINPLMQNVQHFKNSKQNKDIEQFKFMLLNFNDKKEKKIKKFKEIKEIIEFEFTKKAEQELERINSKIDSVDRKIKLENFGEFNPELEKKIEECVFIIDREIANVFEKINSFSNCEIQQQEFPELKVSLEEDVSYIKENIQYLKLYVDYADRVLRKYENMLITLEGVKEPFIENEYFMDKIVKMIKEKLSEVLGPVFPDRSINGTVSRYYNEGREDFASFLEYNSEDREGFKKYSFPYLILM